ncbi:hypothetical protein [Abyssalbus ytuae]|uniref:Uncharacterized protein n=1 Tax=Abyssalbus ytuae TaxID=2926907 RepID=A0A9E7A174_9FLAO|nr:hypothetical protein [Abyssalbus ytuae]UOB19117.1 hypothetical protein MQE35_07425 [Abyssalbus ytuae]
MVKIVSILFSLLITIQSVLPSPEDVAKLSDLIEHARYHYETYGDNFFDFLSLHYGNMTKQHLGDHKEHDNLPFKHKHTISCQHSPFILNYCFVEIDNYCFVEIPFNFFYKDSFSTFEKIKLLHPPKQA